MTTQMNTTEQFFRMVHFEFHFFPKMSKIKFGNFFKNLPFLCKRFTCVVFEESDKATNRGVEYMLKAATLGDRQAMVYMAKAYETGNGLGSQR